MPVSSAYLENLWQPKVHRRVWIVEQGCSKRHPGKTVVMNVCRANIRKKVNEIVTTVRLAKLWLPMVHHRALIAWQGCSKSYEGKIGVMIVCRANFHRKVNLLAMTVLLEHTPMNQRPQLRVIPAWRANIPTKRVNLNVNYVIKVIKRKAQAKNCVPFVILVRIPTNKVHKIAQNASRTHVNMPKVQHFVPIALRGGLLTKVLRQRYVHPPHHKTCQCHRV